MVVTEMKCPASNLLLLKVTLLSYPKVLVYCLYCQGAATL